MTGKPKVIKHGTIGGYVAHKRRNQEACGACKQAWRMYYQRRNDGLPRFVREAREREEKLKAKLAAERREHEMELNRQRQQRWRDRRAAENQAKRAESVEGLPPQDGDAVLDRAPEEPTRGD